MKLSRWIRWIFCTPLFVLNLHSQEICDNGIDDDGDNLVDLNDTDCDCKLDSSNGNSQSSVTSLIPNSSFEQFSCQPNAMAQLTCANGWVQATQASSDYFHSNGYNPPLPTPFPDGIAAVGFKAVGQYINDRYREYIGACLTSPFPANTEGTLNVHIVSTGFSFDFNTGNTDHCDHGITADIDITLFGSATCPIWPVQTGSNGNCPDGINGWHEVGKITYTPNKAWQQITIKFQSNVALQAIMIGPPCTIPAGYHNSTLDCAPFFGLDDLQVNLSSEFNKPTIALDSTGAICNNDLKLSATASEAGGTWQWYHNGIAIVGQTTNELDVMAAVPNPHTGLYTVTYTLNGSCLKKEITINNQEQPTAYFLLEKACAGDSVKLTDSSFVQVGNIASWSWDLTSDGTVDGTSKNISFLPTSNGPFTTTLTVVGSNSCSAAYSRTYSLDQNKQGVDIIVSCEPITWIDGNTYSQSNNTATFFLQSSQGCDSVVTLDLTFNDPPSANFTVENACVNQAASFYDASDGGNMAISEWTWTFENGQQSNNQNTTYIFKSNGTYSVQLTVGNGTGCFDSIVRSVDVYPQPKVLMPEFNSGCSPVCVQMNPQSQNSISIVEWNWLFSDGTTSKEQNPIPCFQTSGTTAEDFFATLISKSDKGCVGNDTFNPIAKVFPIPFARFTQSPQKLNVWNPQVDLSNLSSADAISFFWSIESAGTSTLENPTITLPKGSSGKYAIKLIVENTYGCRDTSQGLIMVSEGYGLYVPNTFTPDGDGVNDFFGPIHYGISEDDYLFTVFNRWGDVVFQTNRKGASWDGSDDLISNEAIQDTYIWKVEAKDSKNHTQIQHIGHVNLVR